MKCSNNFPPHFSRMSIKYYTLISLRKGCGSSFKVSVRVGGGAKNYTSLKVVRNH